ncbi:helix-turn-helix transcriptional regulator [Sulfurimonas sp.]
MNLQKIYDTTQKYGAGKKYLRAREIKENYGIPLSTLWLYAKQGKITPKKISARVTVFAVAELEAFINNVEVA